MKKIILLTSLLAAGIAVSSCTSDDNELFGSKNEVKKIEALICDFEEDADGSSTRTSYTYGSNGYEAVWTEGDILGIYPLGGDQVSFPISKGAGSKTAFFDGGAWALRGTYKYAAYYPFSTDNYTIKETSIPVSYIGQEQKGNNTTAHLSAYDFMAAAATKPSSNGSVTLPFKHLGAFLSMSLTLPKAGTYTSLTLTSDQGEFITGGTVDLSASEPSITAVSKSKSVTLGLNSITLYSDDLVLKVNMMIAPADLTGSTIEIKVTDSDGVSYINEEKAWTCTSAFAANTTIKVSRSLESSGSGEGDNNPEGSETPYLTFCANETQTVQLNQEVPTLEYSVNNGEWTELGTNVVTFGGLSGDLRLRGKSVFGTASPDKCYIYDTDGGSMGRNSSPASFVFGNNSIDVECKGDIRTLIDYESYNTARTDIACFARLFYKTPIVSAPELPSTILAPFCYYEMFIGCTKLQSAPALPANALTGNCYDGMFNGCSKLEKAPDLPAKNLARSCYNSMFKNCDNLVQAPALPAATLANYCYYEMFYDCDKLQKAPALPAIKLAERCYFSMFESCNKLMIPPELPAKYIETYCYYRMFEGCTSLSSAPELPATNLANYCYHGMFWGCTSLSSAPELPATQLAYRCYSDMFNGCTSLSSAPVLPATQLEFACYSEMFLGCTSLSSAPALLATQLAGSCYLGMFYGCSRLSSAPALPATQLAESCYESMFNGCTQLRYVKMMATDISADYCLDGWLNGVAPTGTFVKNSAAKWDEPVIPSGWTVQIAEM